MIQKLEKKNFIPFQIPNFKFNTLILSAFIIDSEHARYISQLHAFILDYFNYLVSQSRAIRDFRSRDLETVSTIVVGLEGSQGNVGENRNAISARKSKNNMEGSALSRGQSALPRSMIGNLQKSPAVSPARIYVVTWPYKCAWPSNGFAVRIALCVEAPVEKCIRGSSSSEFRRVNMKHWFIDHAPL